MEKLVVGDLGDLVFSGDRLCPIDAHPNLGEQTVAHPTCSDLGHGNFPIDGSHRL